MEVLKKLHINIPFIDALEQMPSYVKFMKDILSRKRRLSDFETVNLTGECSCYSLEETTIEAEGSRQFYNPM